MYRFAAETIGVELRNRYLADLKSQNIDVEQELADLLSLEIDRELHAQRLGIDSSLVTDDMARTEKGLRTLDIVKRLKEVQAKEDR